MGITLKKVVENINTDYPQSIIHNNITILKKVKSIRQLKNSIKESGLEELINKAKIPKVNHTPGSENKLNNNVDDPTIEEMSKQVNDPNSYRDSKAYSDSVKQINDIFEEGFVISSRFTKIICLMIYPGDMAHHWEYTGQTHHLHECDTLGQLSGIGLRIELNM